MREFISEARVVPLSVVLLALGCCGTLCALPLTATAGGRSLSGPSSPSFMEKDGSDSEFRNGAPMSNIENLDIVENLEGSSSGLTIDEAPLGTAAPPSFRQTSLRPFVPGNGATSPLFILGAALLASSILLGRGSRTN